MTRQDFGVNPYADSDGLLLGEASMARDVAVTTGVTSPSGTIKFAFWTAKKTEVVTQARMLSGATAAGATPSIVQLGLWTVAANGDLSLVANTTNNTSLLAAASTAYTQALAASYTKIAGQRYASGILVVTAAAAPTLIGALAAGAISTEQAIAPRLSGSVSGQASLPASVLAANILLTTGRSYNVFLP